MMLGAWAKQVRTGLIALMVMIPAQGCAMLDTVGSDKWLESQKEKLVERAETRWVAMRADDIEAAYAYLSPSYRNVVSLQQYRASLGRVLDWRMAKAVAVSYDSPMVASVSVEVAYRVEMPLSRGGVMENTSRLTEKWIYEGGEWWYTTP